MKRPRTLIAMNAFKGSLSNREACAAVAEALASLGIPYHQIPVGDGGRGSRDTMQSKWKGQMESFTATGPLGAPAIASVLGYPDNLNPEKVFIDSPDVCGHSLVTAAERNVMKATSRGLGQLLLACHKRWHQKGLKEIYVGLGDSAISDAGLGMLCSLGFTPTDRNNKPVSADGEGLSRLENIQPPQNFPLPGVRLVILCDVKNPLCGSEGSAVVFAPQKGATPDEVKSLAAGMDKFAEIVYRTSKRSIAQEPMTGSAGGLGAAFRGFLSAELFHGAGFLLDEVDFDKYLKSSDLLITGEGRTDKQTLGGKAPKECLSRASKLKKSAVVISGSLGEGAESLGNGKFLGCYACGREPSAYEALRKTTETLFSDPAFLTRI